jgi:hypothetical protein
VSTSRDQPGTLKLLVGTKDVTTSYLKGTSLTPLVRPNGDLGSQWADSEIGEVRLAMLIVTSVTNPILYFATVFRELPLSLPSDSIEIGFDSMVAISHSKNLPFINCVPFKQGSSALSKHFSFFFEDKFPIRGLAPEMYVVSDQLLRHSTEEI